MWPQVLQMTRDECRGVLRRLELESYSHVISVFRAQGGLTDTKAKILEDLRGVFHISQERHRSEARRVANDEQLSTIAEAISGPNTWQEWSREGRRSYPLLPRVAPQTALALIANNVAIEAALENAKLPFPAETGAAVAEEQDAYAVARDAVAAASTAWDGKYSPYAYNNNNNVVTSDPFKMPDIPGAVKRNLKRNNPENVAVGPQKKRSGNTSDGSPIKQQQHNNNNNQQHNKQYHHITANSGGSPISASTSNNNNNVSNNQNSNIRSKSYHNNNTQKVHQQQQQQQNAVLPSPIKGNKMGAGNRRSGVGSIQTTSTKKTIQGTVPLLTTSTGVATPAKSGRRAHRHTQDQKNSKSQQQQSQPQMQHDSPVIPSTDGVHLYNALSNVGDMTIAGTTGASMVANLPQIAASKKDITKNLNKLHLHQTQNTTASLQRSGASTSASPPVVNTILFSGSSSNASVTGANAREKQLISTPVQKYIVEDHRQPLSPVAGGSPSSTMPQMMMNVSSTVTPIVANTTNTVNTGQGKLRGLTNTMPLGAKIIGKKSLIEQITGMTAGNAAAPLGSSHMYSLIEGNNNNNNSVGSGSSIIGCSGDLPASLVTPLSNHSSTGIGGGHVNMYTHSSSSPVGVQLQSQQQQQPGELSLQQPSQSKVITTKLTPIVLSSSGSAGGSANAINITKIETINNGATLVSGSGVSSGTTASGSPFKNIPSTLLLSNTSGVVGGGSSSGGSSSATPQSTFITSTGAMFRKPISNIIKTANLIGVSGSKITPLGSSSSSSAASSSLSNSGGPQIISNIKLKCASPTIVSCSGITKAFSGVVTSSAPSTTQTSFGVSPSMGNPSTHSPFLQHATLKSGGLRTSVKICQSPNGKVFIQPASAISSSGGVTMDSLKAVGKISGHKLIVPTNPHATGGLVGGTSSATTSMSVTATSGTATIRGNSSGNGGIGGGSQPHQRIAIQKVQIISAPISSPSGTTTTVGGTLAALQKGNPSNASSTTLATPSMSCGGGGASSTFQLSGNVKGNVIYMPASAVHPTSPGSSTFTLTKNAGVMTAKTTIQKPPIASSLPSQANVVVIGGGGGGHHHVMSGSSQSLFSTMPSSIAASSSGGRLHSYSSHSGIGASLALAEEIEMDSSQMITEDTPVDILSMPIVMDNCEVSTSGQSSQHSDGNISNNTNNNNNNNNPTSVVVDIVGSSEKRRPLAGKQQPPGLILDATDWEMELDQARVTKKSHGQKENEEAEDNMEAVQLAETNTNATSVMVDDCFDDVIVEEHDEDDLNSSQLQDHQIAVANAETNDAIERILGMGGGKQKASGHVLEKDYSSTKIINIENDESKLFNDGHGTLATSATVKNGHLMTVLAPAQTTTTTGTIISEKHILADANLEEVVNKEFAIADDHNAIEFVSEMEQGQIASAINMEHGSTFFPLTTTIAQQQNQVSIEPKTIVSSKLMNELIENHVASRNDTTTTNNATIITMNAQESSVNAISTSSSVSESTVLTTMFTTTTTATISSAIPTPLGDNVS